MDWTTNPLVGLFFALEGNAEKCTVGPTCSSCSGSGTHDSAVYVLTGRRGFTVSSLVSQKENGHAPLYGYNEEVGLLWPPHVDGRVAAQSSIFTIRKAPGTVVDPDLRILIPHAARDGMLRDLEHLGITRKTLFLDLDGIAAYLRWSCTNWEHITGVGHGRPRTP